MGRGGFTPTCGQLLPGARTEAETAPDIGAGPSRRRRRDIGRQRVDDRRRHLVPRQRRRRGAQNNGVCRDITWKIPPRSSAPTARAFCQLDLRPRGDPLHDPRVASRPRAHRNGSASHRQFRDRRPGTGDGNAKSKKKTPNHFAEHSLRWSAKIVASPPRVQWRAERQDSRPGARSGQRTAFRFWSPATSAPSARRPARCGNYPRPSSFRAARPRRA